VGSSTSSWKPDAWGFGGTLWVSKVHAAFKEGPPTNASGNIFALHHESRFYLQPFVLPDAGIRGSAIWFQKGPTDDRLPLGNRSLCGWVTPEREVEGAAWISFLNAHILDRIKARVDEFMTKLEDMAAQDGPIDLRTESKKNDE
jgi:hypothetical protein